MSAPEPRPGPAPSRKAPVRSPAAYVQAIHRAATDDAVAVAQRLMVASRTVAVARFEQAWPSVRNRPIPTRTLLRDWYLHVYQQQLDRGLHAPPDSPIDGNRAELVIIEIRDRSGATTEIVTNTILSLARDARALAHQTNTAQERFVTAALAGRIATLFPRHPGTPISARQAIGEQWYARAFRAELDPQVFRRPTPPIEQDEITQVIQDLAAGTHRHLPDPTPTLPLRSADADLRRHAALAWKALPDHRRLLWLTQHGLDEHLFTRGWDKLPAKVFELLKAEVSQSEAVESQARPSTSERISVSLANTAEAAAASFNAAVIGPAGPAEIAAARALFRRGAVAFPPGIVGEQSLQAITEALARLKDATPRSGQTRGLPRQGWWDDKDDLERAVRLRMQFATWKEIGQQLGVTADRAKYGVEHYGNLDPVFTQARPAVPRWTPEELATAAALRANGRSWDDIAALIGRPNGNAVRQAVHAADRRPYAPQEDRPIQTDPAGDRHPSLGL